MNLFLTTLTLDVRLQARHRLYAVGILAAIVLGLVGRFFVHPSYAGRVLAVFYLAGLGSTTFMFSAAMVLLEKSAGTLQALRTTPLTANAYILSKAMTLTCFALLESVIVYAIAFFGVPLNPAPLVIGVFFLGMIYTLIGLGQVASYDSVTMFLFPGAVLVALLLELPMFHVIAGPLPLWYLIPTHGTLLLMLGATETLELWQWAYAIIVPLVSILLAFLWAKRRFARFIGLQEG